MKRRLATTIGATTVVSAALLSCAAPSAHTATTAPRTTVGISPSTLPPGAAPHSEYLVGRTIHPLGAAPIRLPSSWNLGSGGLGLKLVGHAGGAWFVERAPTDSYVHQLYRVTSSGARQIDSGSAYGGSIGWYLSADDQHLIKVALGTSDVTRLTVMSLTGSVVAHHLGEAGGALVGATGSNVWYDGGASGMKADDWSFATGRTTQLPVSGYLADPAHDLLFALPRGNVPAGLTSLSHPSSTLQWSAEFTAVAVSPDGTKVVGFRGEPGHDQDWVMQVRSTGDGSLLQTYQLGSGHSLSTWDELWWEDDQHVLFNYEDFTHQTTVLARCSIDGTCDRAAGPVAIDRPFTHRRVRYVTQRVEDPPVVEATGPAVVPAGLPAGGRAQSDYLVGRDLHTAAGATIHLPGSWPTHSATNPLIRLVGRAGGASYVARFGPRYGVAQLYRVTPSSRRLIDSVNNFLPVVGWYLTSDGLRIVRAWSDGYGDDGEQVLGLRGARIARHDNRDDSNFNGASSTDLWYTATSQGSPAQRWTITSGTVTPLGVGGYLAVPDRDLLFTPPGAGIGPAVTSLSSPGALTWEAQFRAVAVSPDGTKVLGYQGFTETPGRSVEIRNLSDGSLVRSFRFPTGGRWGDIWWESDRNVLLSYTTSDTWLVRCSTAGVCHRVARDASDSLAYTHRSVPPWHAEVSH